MANDLFNLDEAGEWAGLWWLPDEPDEKIPGVLRYDAERGLSLSLIGAFEDRILSSPSPNVMRVRAGSRTWEVIHGAAESKAISLLGCIPSSSRTFGARVGSPAKQVVKATAAIVGAHVNSSDDTAFAAVELSVEDLGAWAATSILEGFHGTTDGRLDGTGSISVKPLEASSVMVGGTDYQLAHRHTAPYFDKRKGGTIGRISDTAFIRIVPEAPYSFNGALQAAHLMQDLVALATHRAAGVLWLRLQVHQTSTAQEGRRASVRRADVLYSPPALGKHDAKAGDINRVFFTCESLPFEVVVPRWCAAHDRLQASLNMIFGLRYAPARFIENNLLTAVGAAEVLHRRLDIDEKPFPAEEFKGMRNAMLEVVPTDYRDRFRGTIRNEPTLRDRLHALAARPDQEAIGLLMPDVGYWAKRTTRARNDLAHEGSTPNHSFEELVAIVEVTTTVVILNVLHELGLPVERQRKIMQEHPQLMTTAHTARRWLVESKLS